MMQIDVGQNASKSELDAINKAIKYEIPDKPVSVITRPTAAPKTSTKASNTAANTVGDVMGTENQYAIPEAITDFFNDPFGTAVEGVYDTLWGTKEDQLNAASKWVPVTTGQDEVGAPVPFSESVQDVVDYQKETVPGASEFYESPNTATGVVMPQITLPNIDILGGLGDLGKYVLIGGAIVLAAILFSKK